MNPLPDPQLKTHRPGMHIIPFNFHMGFTIFSYITVLQSLRGPVPHYKPKRHDYIFCVQTHEALCEYHIVTKTAF